jgi:hypothetical protein
MMEALAVSSRQAGGGSTMFVQVVRGVVRDPEETFARLDYWQQHLGPSAPGWLGTTAGVTKDRELVSFVRFASAADARRNSDRVEQGQWWADSARVFAGDVSFENYDDVLLFGNGGSDSAAVVEVLAGSVKRTRRPAELTSQLAAQGMKLSPGAIGGLVGLQDDGRFTQAFYFCHAEEGPSAASLVAAALANGPAGVADLAVLRLQHLWFGSPEGVRRSCPGPSALRRFR